MSGVDTPYLHIEPAHAAEFDGEIVERRPDESGGQQVYKRVPGGVTDSVRGELMRYEGVWWIEPKLSDVFRPMLPPPEIVKGREQFYLQLLLVASFTFLAALLIVGLVWR